MTPLLYLQAILSARRGKKKANRFLRAQTYTSAPHAQLPERLTAAAMRTFLANLRRLVLGMGWSGLDSFSVVSKPKRFKTYAFENS